MKTNGAIQTTMKKKNTKTYVIISAAIIALALTFSVSLYVDSDDVAYAYNSSSEGWEEGVFNNFDYGIYWYQSGREVPVKWDADGVDFDPSRPTIIFTHGMKQNEGYRYRDILSAYEDTRVYMANDDVDYNTEYYEYYLSNGYNVGHFYWNQIAEESIGGDVKIWSSDTDLGMRYFVSDAEGNRVQGDESKNPTKSVSVLYAENIIAALGENFSGTLHLVGHSMGGDLSLAVAENLIMMSEDGKIGENLLPERVTLLDPYLSISAVKGHIDHRNGVDSEGKTIAELCSEAVVTIANHGIAIDGYGAGNFIYKQYSEIGSAVYKKSKINLLKERFSDNCVWVHLEALNEEIGMFNNHCVVPDYFFLSLYQDKAVDNFEDDVPSARSTAAEIYALRGRAYSQSYNGDSSYLISDSTFTRVDRNQEEVNFIVNVTAPDVYGVRILNADGKVVYSRSSSAPINRVEASLEEGEYTVEYVDADGNCDPKFSAVSSVEEEKTVFIEMEENLTPVVENIQKSYTWVYALIGALAGIAVIFGAICAVLIFKKR